MWNRLLTFLGYLYLVRVPLLAWVVMIALWYGFTSGSGAESVLRGIFDVSSRSAGPAAVVQFGFVMLAAMLAGLAIAVTSRLVVCNAHARFGAATVAMTPGLELVFRVVPAVPVLLVVGAAFSLSTAHPAFKIAGLALGAVGWWFLAVVVQDSLWTKQWGVLQYLRSGRWIPGDRSGYMHPTVPNALQERHTFAAYQFALSLIAYAAAFLKYRSAADGQPFVPTLSLVLLMIMLFTWALAGIAFYIDRYRVPLLAVVVAVASFGGLFRQTDYFHEGRPLQRPLVRVKASDVLQSRLQGVATTEPVIVVATTGGGIQATAWTARVLMGLSRQLPEFSSHVRLVSSVSGGSVGAMYYLASYRDGRLITSGNSLDDDDVVRRAEASSLDDVAWGLAYPDLVFRVAPFLKGIGRDRHGRFHLVDGGLIFADRGRKLEDSWLPRLGADVDPTLADWRADVRDGKRPAAIFNSTMVESGDRYLLATTDFDPPPPGAAADRNRHTGRIQFSTDIYASSKTDLRVRTAARLSATFPFVSPATRLLRNDYLPGQRHGAEGGFYQPEPHAVDGGYYDNYGVVSLLDWLDGGMQTLGDAAPQVMMIEIRSSPTDDEHRVQGGSYGFWFQLLHPLETLWDVRGTGQLSHNAIDKDLVSRLERGHFCSAVFEFKNVDERGCRRSEPLNWHLTPDDITALRRAWGDSGEIVKNYGLVKQFLADGGCPKEAANAR